MDNEHIGSLFDLHWCEAQGHWSNGAFLLGMRVGTMIKPLVDNLISIGLLKKTVARMLEKRASIINYNLLETVKSNCRLLG